MARRLIATATLTVALVLTGPYPSAGQTQADMNEDANRDLRAAESEQRQILEQLRSMAHGKADALETLRAAQAAWEKYRDAQLRTLWPFPERTWYGSVHPMCVATQNAALTRARTRELRAMLKQPEGDVCNSQWPE